MIVAIPITGPATATAAATAPATSTTATATCAATATTATSKLCCGPCCIWGWWGKGYIGYFRERGFEFSRLGFARRHSGSTGAEWPGFEV